ncbi:MAG: histidinol-phosphate transaminase [Sphaerochaetaceae bacterium]
MREYTIRALMRKNIATLTPYSSARNEYTGDAHIFLDANEAPHDFLAKGQRNRYPDPQHSFLKAKISEVMALRRENLVVGNGSDEMIDLLFRIFCEPRKDKVLIVEPTYGAYAVFAAINDVEVSTCYLREDYSLDFRCLDTIFGLMENGTPQRGMHKMMFLCSPNNPTGNSFPLEEIERVAQRFPGITVVDEAYIEFSEKPSAVTLMSRCPRLVVLRTFSKGWALANARVGLAVAPPEIVKAMHNVKYPYNLSGVAQDIALEVLEQREQMEANVKMIRAERQRMQDALANLPFVEKVFPSDANFLLVRVKDPDATYNYLRERGIIVRNRSKLRGCYGSLRITIASEEENSALLEALQEMEG